ncbi:MAG: S8 family serine peptidase, partial [Flavicella sp.]
TIAQVEDAWVYFKDKPNATYYLDNPLEMLTQRSLDRRDRQGIQLTEKDVPLHPDYVSNMASINGVSVLARSKWLNAIHIRAELSIIFGLLSENGVQRIEFANKDYPDQVNKINLKTRNKFENEIVNSSSENNSLLTTDTQIEMLHGDFLHDKQLYGENMHMAILDAGFSGVQTYAAFSLLHDNEWSNGEVIGGYNFVDRNSNFYANVGSTHGLEVLSTIAATVGTTFKGTAPKAKFYLFVTEDAPNESPLEESLWVEAAERADSLGVDIINTSLGYTTFDKRAYDYNYFNMDGATTFISRGAELATSTGMFLINAAGNSGNDPWRFIGAPADAPSVLSVGAVDAYQNTASFSSFGPSADNRVKPEVLAQGRNTVLISGYNGYVGTSNGTSFASPIMAGLVACLMEAFPNATVQDVRNAIINSSDLKDNPTNQRGYGLPNFETAYDLLGDLSSGAIKLKANFINNSLTVTFPPGMTRCNYSIYNVLGALVMSSEIDKNNAVLDVKNCSKGMYVVVFTSDTKQSTFKFLKK